jgi:TonB family protein
MCCSLRFTICLTVLALMSSAQTAWATECTSPSYRVGRVWVDSESAVLMSISVRLEDLAPRKLVCLAETLRRGYSGKSKIDVLIFTSREAAEQYSTGNEGDFEGRRRGRSRVQLELDLHGTYVFDAVKGEHFVEIHPGWTLYSRIPLPVTEAPRCRYEVNARCLLAVGDYVYPQEVNLRGGEGTVRLSVTIGKDGRVGRSTVLTSDVNDLALQKAALRTVTAWRFEPSSKMDAFEIDVIYRLGEPAQRGQLLVDVALPSRVTMTAGRLASERHQ